MSKRPLKPLGFGGNLSKLPKLEITISDHNFPLSQNFQQRSCPRDVASELWGDDNADDLLLQASQACEQNDVSLLPDYNAWQKAPSASTQNNNECGQNVVINENRQTTCIPTTSQKQKNISLSLKSNFQFKTPAANPRLNCVKDERMLAPLSCISANVKESAIEESFVMDNARGDTEKFYKRLLQVQEENAKLKSENSKLLEQALSKDGEVTILRGRLKSSQATVDAVRLEKLQASERLQIEWSDKLALANKDVGSLKTQLECKELELMRIRERCKMMESNKIKMSEVPSTQLNSTQLSLRPINNHKSKCTEQNGTFLPPGRTRDLIESSVQTDKRHNSVQLHAACRSKTNSISNILPLLLEPECEGENMFRDLLSDYTQIKYRNLDMVQADQRKQKTLRKKLNITRIYEELSGLATVTEWNCLDEGVLRMCLSILQHVKLLLTETLKELEMASQKVTTAFQTELDSKYINEISQYSHVETKLLFCGRSLFKEEQKIAARRGVATLAELCSICPTVREHFWADGNTGFSVMMGEIVNRIDSTSSAVQYSGLLLSFIYLIKSILKNATIEDHYEILSKLTKDIVLARPSLSVICAVLPVLRLLSLKEVGLREFCINNNSGNLKMDYENGMILFMKESCFLQVILCQLETCFKCMERQEQVDSAVSLARGVLSFYRSVDLLQLPWCIISPESQCKCGIRFAQLLVYVLKFSARLLNSGLSDRSKGTQLREGLLTICRSGLSTIYRWTLREYDLRLLDRYAGCCHVFIDECCDMRQHICLDEIQGQVLTELQTSLRTTPEDMDPPAAALNQLWVESFSQFRVTD